MSDKRILIAVADSEAREELRQAFGEHWQVTLAASGTAALAEMEKQPCDVLVADLDLPELDGAELLNQTRKKYPNSVLFILAAEADKERVMKNVLGAHQFLTKPCDKATLKNAIERALALDTWIANNKMRELVARIRTFPTVPSLYLEVLTALRSPSSTTDQIGAIIAKDMAMMTKLLQVLNSACFGLPRRITDPAEAVGILGFEAVKSMVMTIKLLNQYDKIKPVYFSIDRLWRHSTEVARTAKQLVQIQTDDSAMADTAFTAGLMHDLGKIVLAANFDEQYRGAQSLARKQRLPFCEVEREFFGASHGEIGAYLLGLWGMPLDLLEVAALHHQPSRSINKGFTVLTAVHVANAFEYELNPEKEGAIVSKVDEAYLAEIGMSDRLSVWRDVVFRRDSVKSETKRKPEVKAKTEEKAKPAASATFQVITTPLPSSETKPNPVESPVVPAVVEKVWLFTPKQWAFAGVGTAFVVLLLAWLVTSTLTSGSDKLNSEQPVVARARETAPGPDQTAVTGKPSDGNPDNTQAVVATTVAASAQPVPQELAFADLKLQGIFYSKSHPTAILNGQMVHPKDHLVGALVVDIGPSSVTLEYKNQRKVLVLK
jgi:HD-like signal output (HDOD) protein/CheY-like chemotaxis protein